MLTKKRGIKQSKKAIVEMIQKDQADKSYGIVASYTYNKENVEDMIKLLPDDYKEAISVYERVYGESNTRKVALRVAVWNFLYFLKPVKGSKVIEQTKKNSEEIKIAFQLAGGYGDYLLFANWFWYFWNYIC